MDAVAEQFEAARALYAPLLGHTEAQLADVGDGLLQATQLIEDQRSNHDRALQAMHAMMEQRALDVADLERALLATHAKDWAEAEGVRDNVDAIVTTEATSPTVSRRLVTTKTYEGVVDFAVDNNSHTKLYRFIERDATSACARVLEVGCHTGYFGAALKACGFEVWGIEPDASAAAVAQSHLDRVLVGSVERYLNAPELDGERFDYVVFGDVLEHLSDPHAVLAGCGRLLREHGAVVASIPNVAHAAVRLMLLSGRWDYAENGILDDTHLRFFTVSSIHNLFESAGFDVEDVDTIRVGLHDAGVPVDDALSAAARPFIQDDAADVFQYAVLARVRPATQPSAWGRAGEMPLRLLVLPPVANWTIGDLRFEHPLRKYCLLYGGELRVRPWFEHRQYDLDWADVVFFQREANPTILDIMTRLRNAGKLVVFDMDDLLTDMPAFLTAAARTTERRHDLLKALATADVVSVTTERLRAALSPLCKRTHVVENCTFAAHPPVTHVDGKPVRLIVASSDTVRIDFIVSALARIIDTPGLNVELIGVGPPGDFLAKAGFALAHRVGVMGHLDFKAFISSFDNAVGLIPLDDSRFSACKSAIKFVDYALAGVPSVCSNVAPYADVVVDGETGVLCANEESAWVSAVIDLAASAAKRQRLSSAARHIALREFGVSRAATAWQSLLVSSVAPARRATVAPPPVSTRCHALARLVVQRSRSLTRLVGGHCAVVTHLMTKRATYATAREILREEGRP